MCCFCVLRKLFGEKHGDILRLTKITLIERNLFWEIPLTVFVDAMF